MITIRKSVFKLTIAIVLILLLPMKILAVDYLVDQENTTNIDSGSAALKIYGRDLGQTFQVENIDKITAVEVYIKYPSVGSWMDVEIIRVSDSSTVATGGNRMDTESSPGAGVWQSLPVGEATLESGVDYSIQVILDTNYSTMWARSNSDAYANGISYKDGNPDSTDDFGFKVWGYAEEVIADPEPDPIDDTSEDPVEPAEDDSLAEDSVDAPEEDVEDVEEDDTISTPSLTSLVIGEVEYTEFDETFEIKQDQTFTMKGESGTDTEVVLWIGENVYTTQTDENDEWMIQIEVIDTGDYTVTAQARKDESGSKKVDLCNVSVQEVKLGGPFEQVDYTPKERSFVERLTVGDLRWVSILILSIMLLALIGLLLYVVWKRRKSEETQSDIDGSEMQESHKKSKKSQKQQDILS